MNNFSIYSMDSTNEDVIIKYTPSSLTINYKYTIIKDGKEERTVYVKNNTDTDILLSDTGIYQIKVVEYYNNEQSSIMSGIYHIDKEEPVITVKQDNIKINEGDRFNTLDGIKAYDNIDGDISNLIKTNEGDIYLNKVGSHKLIYTVSDSAGNTTNKTVIVEVMKNDAFQLLITQIIFLVILMTILISTLKYSRSLKIEKRIARYSVKPIKDNSRSLFGNINRFINNKIKQITKILNKSVFVNKFSKRYLKYVKVFGSESDTTITIVAQKIILSIVFLLIAIIAKTIRLQVMSIYEIIIPMLVGYYTLDFVYAFRYKSYRKSVENDFLQAIIIMNNAFKSGRSIMQATLLVSTELDGPMALEFNKMALELSFGLDIEVVFKRFSERINLEEAAYLTASLAITNKTGGNIIRVFDSIEKTLFNRKKLKLELKALTGSSKLIMYVLMFVPIFFVLVISIINSSYFMPLFINPLGLVLIFVMLVIYITYIIIIRKIISIRM